MVMWSMSDCAIPRSLRMMEGFGVHTFRLVTCRRKSSFCQISLEARAVERIPLFGTRLKQFLGKDPDFHRRDLWESIENGDYPEYELGIQIIDEEDEFKFDS